MERRALLRAHSASLEEQPRGKQVTWDAIAIFRIQNGKIAEEWVNREELGDPAARINRYHRKSLIKTARTERLGLLVPDRLSPAAPNTAGRIDCGSNWPAEVR